MIQSPQLPAKLWLELELNLVIDKSIYPCLVTDSCSLKRVTKWDQWNTSLIIIAITVFLFKISILNWHITLWIITFHSCLVLMWLSLRTQYITASSNFHFFSQSKLIDASMSPIFLDRLMLASEPAMAPCSKVQSLLY